MNMFLHYVLEIVLLSGIASIWAAAYFAFKMVNEIRPERNMMANLLGPLFLFFPQSLTPAGRIYRWKFLVCTIYSALAFLVQFAVPKNLLYPTSAPVKKITNYVKAVAASSRFRHHRLTSI
jgi:hypothetical protein